MPRRSNKPIVTKKTTTTKTLDKKKSNNTEENLSSLLNDINKNLNNKNTASFVKVVNDIAKKFFKKSNANTTLSIFNTEVTVSDGLPGGPLKFSISKADKSENSSSKMLFCDSRKTLFNALFSIAVNNNIFSAYLLECLVKAFPQHNFNKTDKDGYDPFAMYLAQYWRYILKQKDDPDLPLYFDRGDKLLNICKLFIDKGYIDLDKKRIGTFDSEEMEGTTIELFANVNNLKLLKYLLDKSNYNLSKSYVVKDMTDYIKKATPLMIYASHQNIEAVKLLVGSKKIDINHSIVAPDGRSYNALSFATDIELGKVLIKAGISDPETYRLLFAEREHRLELKQVTEEKKKEKEYNAFETFRKLIRLHKIKEKLDDTIVKLQLKKLSSVQALPDIVASSSSSGSGSKQDLPDIVASPSSSSSGSEQVLPDIAASPSSSSSGSEQVLPAASSSSSTSSDNESDFSEYSDNTLDDLLASYVEKPTEEIAYEIRQLCLNNNQASIQVISTLGDQNFAIDKLDELVTELISDWQILNKYFTKRSEFIGKKFASLGEDTKANDVCWNVDGNRISVEEVTEITSSMNCKVYIKIDEDCKKKPSSGLDSLSIISNKSKGENGVKFRHDKGLVVLKTKSLGDTRLVTNKIYQDQNGDLLVVFKDVMNHKKIERVDKKYEKLPMDPVELLSGEDNLPDDYDDVKITGGDDNEG